jgi:hypothetical protein
MVFKNVLFKPLSLVVLALMAQCLYLAFFAPLPLPYNPLFLFCSDSATVWFSQLSVFYLLVPAHLLEGIIACYLAFSSGYPASEVLAWTLQTALLGYPSLGLLRKLGNPKKK